MGLLQHTPLHLCSLLRHNATEIQQVEQDCGTVDLCVFAIHVRAANNIYPPL